MALRAIGMGGGIVGDFFLMLFVIVRLYPATAIDKIEVINKYPQGWFVAASLRLVGNVSL